MGLTGGWYPGLPNISIKKELTWGLLAAGYPGLPNISINKEQSWGLRRLVTQVYPIFPLKKNNIFLKKQNLRLTGADTQIYPTYLRLNYIILHKNIRTSNLLAAMYVSNILKFLNPIFKQVNQRLISTSSCHSCQQGGWEGNKYIFFPLTLLLLQNIELHFAAPSWT